MEALTLRMERKGKLSLISFIPFSLLFIWVLLLFLTPLTESPHTIYLGNQGKVSMIDNSPYIKMHIHNEIARLVYLSGDFMCHQHADRSLFINGNQMPYCARCTGIFLGLTLGALIGALFRVKISFSLYILSILPLGIDGTVQLLTSYTSSNLIRMITGSLTGAFTSLVFWYVYYDSLSSQK